MIGNTSQFLNFKSDDRVTLQNIHVASGSAEQAPEFILHFVLHFIL